MSHALRSSRNFGAAQSRFGRTGDGCTLRDKVAVHELIEYDCQRLGSSREDQLAVPNSLSRRFLRDGTELALDPHTSCWDNSAVPFMNRQVARLGRVEFRALGDELGKIRHALSLGREVWGC